MARDDILDRELTELEKEIEAKVDSLFVEMGEGVGSMQGEEDPWKRLKELFLALEWEIEECTLLKICTEVGHLQSRFPEGAVGTLLEWMGETSRRIRVQGREVDQEGVQLLRDLKDALFGLVEDPFRDSGPVLRPLRPRVEGFLVRGEEAPTISLEAACGEELLGQGLDRKVGEALRPQQEPLFEPEAGPAAVQEVPPVEAALEKPWEEDAVTMGRALPEEICAEAQAEPTEQIDRVKVALSDCGRKLEGLVTELSAADPLGVRSAFETAARRLKELAGSLESVVASLKEQVQTLWSLDLVPRPVEPEVRAQPEGTNEDVLFVSVSNRVFGIPMAWVRGVFRVPARSVSQVMQLSEVTLKGNTVPLVPLWKKLGLGRALYTFPKEEKRILLVGPGSGKVGILVDQVLARQEVLVRPVEEHQRALFKGTVTVEKNALVVDIEAL